MRYRLISLGEAGLVEDGGASVDFPMGKPFGILAYLSLSSDPVARDELASVFWSESDPSRARHSLRQALSFLRRRLGEDVFATDDPVVIEPTVLETDVDLLRQALRDNDIDRVLELYGGPFLETFQLASSAAWDHWVEIQRRILEERVAAALREAAERAATPEEAVAVLHRAVEIEPHRFDHRRALVNTLLEQGDLAGATSALAETRQADLEANGQLSELEARVAAVRENLRAGADDVTEIRPEFVGRTAELASLTATWREAARGHRKIAILNGPTGIGKTRLAEELGAVVSATGQVVHVKASSMERRLDWSMTAELARSLYRLPGAAGIGAGAMNVLRSLVPSLGGAETPSPTIAPRPVAVSDALVDLVGAVAYEAPLLIILDDMQWVDRASLALLLRMVRQIRDEPVMVILTFRSEELGTREYDAISALVQEERASMSLLHTLGEKEVQEMLTLDLDEPPERIERLASRLHNVTRGHPLFLVEILRSLRDDGLVVMGDSGWRFRDPDPIDLELPASVRLVIDKRLEQLSSDARRLGSELTTLPPSVGIARVRARLELSDADFTAALNELIDRAVVSWDPNGRLVFTHDQLREAMANGHRRARHRAWGVAAAVVVLAALAGLAAVALEAVTPKPRYGGGRVILISDDTALAMVPAGDPEEWRVEAVQFPVPALTELPIQRSVFRLVDGSTAWVGAVTYLDETPEGAVYWGPGRQLTTHWPGDDGVIGVSPDGRFLLWATEHLPTPEYDRDLRVVPVQGDTGWVVAGPASIITGVWSPDGTRIALGVGLRRDSLLVISPRGDRLFSRSYFQVRPEDWCGPGQILVTARETATSPLHRILVDLEKGTETVLDSSAAFSATCSPDGHAYISRDITAEGAPLVLTEIETGARFDLPSGPARDAGATWLPDRPGPVPTSLRVGASELVLERGETRPVTARVHFTDGSDSLAHVTWHSLDPSIASVLGDGSVAANRPGTVGLVATFARWLTDTVRVTVRSGSVEALILADDFRRLDTLRWMPIGDPTAASTLLDGQPVLQLLGDGKYADGLISRTPRHTPSGMTVEFEFRMPFTTNQYQDLRVYLTDATPPDDPDARQRWSAWSENQAMWIRMPAYELDKWSPRLVRLSTRRGPEDIGEIPGTSDPATWTHLALQVQADGLGSVWIDRQKVAEVHVPRDFLERSLRVAIFGRTYQTEAYVRNFAWWSEPRYR